MTAIRLRYRGKNLTACLKFAKSASIRKFKKAHAMVPKATALGNPFRALFRTFQSPIPAKIVHITAITTINLGGTLVGRGGCSSTTPKGRVLFLTVKSLLSSLSFP